MIARIDFIVHGAMVRITANSRIHVHGTSVGVVTTETT